jgi:hypothetical protein
VLVGALGQGENYAALIQVFKEVGDANLLSSPRITALNNQEAKILVGTSQPYATNTVTQGTSTTTTATNLQFLDVGVKLYVTPTINKDNIITMKIRPEVSSISGNYTYGDPATTVPIVATTQAETSVTVKDGTTIIIAGLIKDDRASTVDKIPLLGDIPVIGAAFRKSNKEIIKTELVVFLTPHIISGVNDYTEQPETAPIGQKLFTEPEKPTFDRRTPVPMKPGMFKEKKDYCYDAPLCDGSVAEQWSAVSTADEYYYSVRDRIMANIRLPKGRKYSRMKGKAQVTFVLSREGNLVAGPRIESSTNRLLNSPCVDAVKRAAPYPSFPPSMEEPRKKFVVEVATE